MATKIASKDATLEATSEMGTLLQDERYTAFPTKGDVVKGLVIAVGRNEVRVDLGGVAIGLVRGPELDPSAHLTVGDEVEATVIDLDNEFGELELSLKGAGRKKSWDKIKELFTSGVVIQVKVLDANKDATYSASLIVGKIPGCPALPARS